MPLSQLVKHSSIAKWDPVQLGMAGVASNAFHQKADVRGNAVFCSANTVSSSCDVIWFR